MVLRDDDRDGDSTDNDCGSISDAGNGCSGSEYLSFVYNDDSDIVTDASQTRLSGSEITAATTTTNHRLIFTAQGQLYELNTLPTDLTNGCTDLSGESPLSNGSTIALGNGLTLTADGATAYVAIDN